MPPLPLVAARVLLDLLGLPLAQALAWLQGLQGLPLPLVAARVLLGLPLAQALAWLLAWLQSLFPWEWFSFWLYPCLSPPCPLFSFTPQTP